jgi:elongation factor G
MLHLEIKQHRMERDFHLKVRVGQPRVSYRETLAHPIRVEGECVRQAGTSNLFGKVTVEFTPVPPLVKGTPSVVVRSRLKPERLPPQLLAAAENGVRGALDSGEMGYPVMNVQAILVDAEMDLQTSNEAAFMAAGADAVRKAMRDNIVLMEPVMRLEVTVPEEYLGPVHSDLNARGADIKDVLAREKSKLRVVLADVPLRRMFDYMDKVRSLTQGRASASMEPHEYRAAPPEILHGMLHPDDSY